MMHIPTTPALRAFAHDAHCQRSRAAWRMIALLSGLPSRLGTRHENGAARLDGPEETLACAT